MEFQQEELMSLDVHVFGVKVGCWYQSHEHVDHPYQQKTVETAVSGRLPLEKRL